MMVMVKRFAVAFAAMLALWLILVLIGLASPMAQEFLNSTSPLYTWFHLIMLIFGMSVFDTVSAKK